MLEAASTARNPEELSDPVVSLASTSGVSLPVGPRRAAVIPKVTPGSCRV
jgi:hypothetical protein